MTKLHWWGAYQSARVLVALLCDGHEGSLPRRRVCFSGLGRRWGVKNGGRLGSITPRLSGDETRQAVEQHGEDRLIGGAGLLTWVFSMASLRPRVTSCCG